MKKVFSAICVIMFITNGLFAQKLAPGVDIVGYGYDVFGKFADNSSKKPYQIFDLGSKKEVQIGSDMYLVPSNVTMENIGRKEKTIVSGSNKREYAKSFGVSAGVDVDALTFGASVEASFSNSWGGYAQEYFYTIRDANRIWRIGMDKRIDLKTILDPQAQKDINSMEPSKLFDLYGTHVIVSAYLGGRADFTMVTKITEQYSETDIAAAASLSYTKVSANVSSNYSTSQNSVVSNSKTSLTVTGGNAEYANDISNFDAYKLWADGIRTLPVLCDFEKGSLLPIWELASTQTRRNQLQNAFDQLCKQYPLPEAIAGIGVGMANATFFVKSKSAGTYWDFAGFHFEAQTQGGILGLAGKDLNAGGSQGGDRFIKIIPHITEPEYVFFQPQHAIEVIDVKDGSKSAGGVLWLFSKGDNNAAQMFRMVEVDGEPNTYTIQNKNSGLFLTEKGGKITQETEQKNSDNQKWEFEKAPASLMAPPPLTGLYNKYIITLDASGLLWDVDNAGGEGSRIKLNKPNGGMAQVFSLERLQLGGLFMVPRHNWGLNLDMHDKKGDDLRVWSRNNSESQIFSFEWAGKPRVYKIRRGNSYITADANFKNSVGCKVYADQKGNSELQDWKMNLTHKVSFKSKWKGSYLNTFNGVKSTNVDANNAKAQWYIEPAPDGYVYIRNAADGTLLNIENGKLESSNIGAGAHSGHWKIETVPGDGRYVRIKNRWKGTTINIVDDAGNMECGSVDDGWDSPRWEMYFKL